MQESESMDIPVRLEVRLVLEGVFANSATTINTVQDKHGENRRDLIRA